MTAGKKKLPTYLPRLPDVTFHMYVFFNWVGNYYYPSKIRFLSLTLFLTQGLGFRVFFNPVLGGWVVS
jgi:hypothetical protein